MSENKKSADLKIFQKLKSIKHIEIIVAIAFAVIVLLIYSSSTETRTSSTQTDLETRLECVLSDIDGAGNVSVLINSNNDQIDGVIVVCSGADDIGVKLNILRAVETVLKIPTSQIEILVGNK